MQICQVGLFSSSSFFDVNKFCHSIRRAALKIWEVFSNAIKNCACFKKKSHPDTRVHAFHYLMQIEQLVRDLDLAQINLRLIVAAEIRYPNPEARAVAFREARDEWQHISDNAVHRPRQCLQNYLLGSSEIVIADYCEWTAEMAKSTIELAANKIAERRALGRNVADILQAANKASTVALNALLTARMATMVLGRPEHKPFLAHVNQKLINTQIHADRAITIQREIDLGDMHPAHQNLNEHEQLDQTERALQEATFFTEQVDISNDLNQRDVRTIRERATLYHDDRLARIIARMVRGAQQSQHLYRIAEANALAAEVHVVDARVAVNAIERARAAHDIGQEIREREYLNAALQLAINARQITIRSDQRMQVRREQISDWFREASNLIDELDRRNPPLEDPPEQV